MDLAPFYRLILGRGEIEARLVFAVAVAKRLDSYDVTASVDSAKTFHDSCAPAGESIEQV